MDQNFSFATVLTTLLPLAVILACLMAVAYFGRRIRSGRFGLSPAQPSAINIIATRSFGGQSSLLIVEAEGRRFLVSAGRQGIRPIGSLDPTSPIAAADFLPRGEAGPA
jgi:flagellar biogenesis protein FliO